MTANLVLAGMPGTGKTTVGRLVAHRTGRAFLDLDELVARRAGRPAADILRQDGEAAFRAAERAAVLELVGLRATVVALGGWTVGRRASRVRLAALGPVVCLTATVEELAARLSADHTPQRPLLAGPESLTHALRKTLASRRPVYDAFPLQVDTTGRAPEAAAAEVEALVAAAATLAAAPIAVPVRTPGGGYAVLVGAGLLELTGRLARARGLTGRWLVVADANVGPGLGPRLERSLQAAGIQAGRAGMAAGEGAKTLATVADLYHAFLAADLDRDGTVAALGGGVVGDVAGFAAATYLRGVRLVHLPTTLLAMVDAALGGKTGVDLPQGKNLVGAFHQPALVLADPSVLASLPPSELRHGLAEVVKTALVGDARLLRLLEAGGAPEPGDAAAWTEIVTRCVRVKAALVGADPWDRGVRQRLNLGHTFAHGLEAAGGYAMPHGRAVAVGLVAACRLAARLGLAEDGLAPRVEHVLRRLGLPVAAPGSDPGAVWAAMAHDKKRRGGRLRLVLPRAVGVVETVSDVPPDEVLAVLAGLAAPD